MLFRQMKYFAAVVECGSFTEAAEQCYISQSAISQQIRALERELGVELIHRENRRFSLTPAGEYFYSRARAVLDEIGEIRRETIRIGQDEERQLRIGYLRNYSGQELHQAVAEFSQSYPEISISIVNGTHEELYDLLRFKKADLVLTDQRRAFSDQYHNFQLLKCGCCAELSVRSPLGTGETVEQEDLKRLPCILISSKDQQAAESLEEGRLMVAGNRGFLPVENVGTLPPPGPAVRRLPIMQNGRRLERNYCVFWLREQTDYYIEEFAELLKRLLYKECGTEEKSAD